MFIRIVFLPPNISLAKASYQTLPLMQGFLSGYDTMDAVAGLNFGFVVALALRRKGILNQTKINNYTIKAGFGRFSLICGLCYACKYWHAYIR